ncbi:hypothetical protein JXO59_03985 [candidate division KSB1 bacterium]|nr:hypothetical protein [candidate division KSB1 bacterium]
MAKIYKSDWVAYWAEFNDLDLLQYKSSNLDETLQEIEQQAGFKLLSGDQMQVIVALEDRIRELSKTCKNKKQDLQVSLFD